MDFFVQLSRKYSKYKLKEFDDVCEKVLNALLEFIPGQRLVKKFNDPDYKLMHDKFLVSSTVSHFKGLNSIIITTKYVNSASIYDQDEQLHQKQYEGKGYYLSLDQKKPGNSIMIFQNCEHCHQVSAQMIKR
jgi:hypothetical protein